MFESLEVFKHVQSTRLSTCIDSDTDSNAHPDLGICNFKINQTAPVGVNTSSIFCLMLLSI